MEAVLGTVAVSVCLKQQNQMVKSMLRREKGRLLTCFFPRPDDNCGQMVMCDSTAGI